MSFYFFSVAWISKHGFICHVLLAFFLVVTSHGAQAANKETTTIDVGAIVDFNSRIGKEQRAAMEIAARIFKNGSMDRKLSLYFQDSRNEPLIAASSG